MIRCRASSTSETRIRSSISTNICKPRSSDSRISSTRTVEPRQNLALGEWFVYARAAIAGGEAIDFNNAPVSVWESDPAVVTARAKELAGADGSVVVIRTQAPRAHRFAEGLGGRYQSMKEMECRVLFDTVSSLDDATGLERGAILIELAQSVVSGLGNTGTVGRHIESYRQGKFPSVPNGRYGPVISSPNSFTESGDAAAGRNALRHLVDASAVSR